MHVVSRCVSTKTLVSLGDWLVVDAVMHYCHSTDTQLKHIQLFEELAPGTDAFIAATDAAFLLP